MGCRVNDDCVLDVKDCSERAHVGLMASGEDDCVFGSHPTGEVLFQLDVHGSGAVQQTRSGKACPVLVQSLAGTLNYTRVASQAQIVIGAEHDSLGAFHLNDRGRRRLNKAEIGQKVSFTGSAELFLALVASDFGEKVNSCRHR